MKLIHCSDLHLDSALGSNFSAEAARERNAELCAGFARMVSYALSEQVEAVLIAGDLFDSAYAAEQTVRFVLDTIRSASGITFFYIRGNHDESDAILPGAELPLNLITFGNRWESHRCGEAVITAMEPEGAGWLTMYDRLCLDENELNIVMLHGQISTQPAAEQIALPLLRYKQIRYLALGHLHTYQKGRLDAHSEYCYSGCPEGRGFDECGEKGFVLLEAVGGRLESRFVPFAQRVLHDIPVDITDAQTVTQILSRLEQAAADIPAGDLVKFTLQGSYDPQTQKDLVFLQKMLAHKFYLVRIKDESRLQIPREQYELDISLKGEFIRTVLASQHTQQDKDRIITCGLRALRGEEVLP